MPPLTPEEQEADLALESKLGAFFEEEMAAETADTAPVPEAPAVEETDEVPAAEAEPADDEEPQPDERPRDPETGRFLPRNIEVDDPEVQKYLEKYQGDPVKALKAATEAQKLIGRKEFEENAELREQVRQLREMVERQQQPAQPQYDQATLDDWFSENPHQVPFVAAQAHRAGNTALRDAAIAAWEEFDRNGARQFERAVLMEELRGELTQATQAERAQQAAWQDAQDRFRAQHPDYDKLAPAMMEIAQQSPRILGLLESDDPEARLEVLDFLYTKAALQARARETDTLTTAEKQAAEERAERARAAKLEAQVGSAAKTVETKPKTGVDAWKDEFRKVLFDNSTSIQAGLTTD